MSTGYARLNDFEDPSEAGADDFEIGGDLGHDKSVDDATRNRLPLGVQVLRVLSVSKPEIKEFKAWLNAGEPNERAVFFKTPVINVTLCDPMNPNLTIDDQHRLAPGTPDEREAYWRGVPADRNGMPDRNKNGYKKGGFWGYKFLQFLKSIGYDVPPGAPIPAEARKSGNWKFNADGSPKLVQVEISERSYEKNGETRKASQVSLYSYQAVPQDGSRVASTAATPSPARQAYRAPAFPTGAAVDVDEIAGAI